VLPAGPGRDGAETLVAQNRAIARAAGASEAERIAKRARELFDAVTEYGRIEETLDPAARDLVRDWILERFGG